MRPPDAAPPVGPHLWCAPLASLALRRAARPSLVLVTVGLAALLGAADWTPETLRAELAGGAVARGLARQAGWCAALAVAAPALALHSAATFARWRGGEADWLGARPVAPGAVVLSTWGGAALGALATLVLAALAIELAVGSAPGGTLRLAWARSIDDPPRVEPGASLEVELRAPPTTSGARVRARLRPTYGSSPTTDVRVTVARAGAERAGEVTRLAGRTWMESPVPPGDGPILWRVDDVGAGSLAVVGDGAFEVWEPAATERWASLALLARGAALLALGTALALALGAWLSPWTAALTVGALGLALCAWAPGAPLAGADLARGLGHVGLGRVPPAVAPHAWLVAGAGVLAALALARAGARTWGSGA